MRSMLLQYSTMANSRSFSCSPAPSQRVYLPAFQPLRIDEDVPIPPRVSPTITRKKKKPYESTKTIENPMYTTMARSLSILTTSLLV